MGSLSGLMTSLRAVTAKAIECLKEDELDKFDDCITSRGRIIGEIMGIGYSTDEFRELNSKLGLVRLDCELNELAQVKKEILKKEMGNLTKNKRAHGAYNKSFTNNSYFVKRKI